MSRIKTFIFGFVTILGTFLILEFGSRFLKKLLPGDIFQKPGAQTLAFNTKDLSPFSFFGRLPSLELRPNENFFYEFDDKKVLSQKTKNEFRIFILGGSVAKGYGATTPQKKFYKILEKKLKKHKPLHTIKEFNVVSAGRIGYVSGQELILLINGILDFQPDMVIFLNGANDMIAVSQYHESPGYPFYFQSLKKALEASKLEKRLDQNLRESVFFSDLKKMLKKYKTSSIDLTKKNIIRHYKRNMLTSAQILKVHQIDAYFFLQPLLQFKYNKSLLEKKFIKTLSSQSIMMWQATYPLMSNTLEEIAESTKMKWKDLSKAFDNERQTVFADSVHLTDLGQSILGNIIFKEIRNESYKE